MFIHREWQKKLWPPFCAAVKVEVAVGGLTWRDVQSVQQKSSCRTIPSILQTKLWVCKCVEKGLSVVASLGVK